MSLRNCAGWAVRGEHEAHDERLAWTRASRRGGLDVHRLAEGIRRRPRRIVAPAGDIPTRSTRQRLGHRVAFRRQPTRSYAAGVRHRCAEQRPLPGIKNVTELCVRATQEPGAGSDLAAVSTSARRWRRMAVNGQKVWTSQAHEADWCFVVARTNRDLLATKVFRTCSSR